MRRKQREKERRPSGRAVQFSIHTDQKKEANRKNRQKRAAERRKTRGR